MANFEEQQYLTIMHRLINEGHFREGRNGATYSLFGEQMKFDLSAGFPLLTTKKVFFHALKVELIWMLRGLTNNNWLLDRGVTIWNEWADENGELGSIYGHQWRNWRGVRKADLSEHGNADITIVDQMQNLLDGLRHDPYGRRHIVNAWQPAELADMALPPCHCFFQCHVSNGKLNLQLYQRSADWFLGVPFNIASYALLTHLIARECGFEPGTFVHTFGDLHLYANHVNAAKEQLSRSAFDFPELVLPRWTKETSIFEIEPEDISIAAYQSHGVIKAPVSA